MCWLVFTNLIYFCQKYHFLVLALSIATIFGYLSVGQSDTKIDIEAPMREEIHKVDLVDGQTDKILLKRWLICDIYPLVCFHC